MCLNADTDLSCDADFIPYASLSWLLERVWYVLLGYDYTRSRALSVEVTRRLDDENARHVLYSCQRYR
jgi:hypothetical protein